MNRKRLYTWIKILIISYCSIGIVLYYLQDYLLFHPEKLDRNYQYRFKGRFEETNINFNLSDTINMIKFFPPAGSTRRGIVLYFHGNRQNIGHYAVFADNFTKQGYEVWMEDYPGFGKSTGSRTEEKMYAQALQIKKMADVACSADSVIIYGKSFGTGIAAYVASVTDCRSLILETPYYSIPDLFHSYAPIYPTDAMSAYKLRINKYLEDVKAPVTIFHGTSDRVISLRCSGKLKSKLKAGDRFITIEDGGHNNLNNFAQFHQVLDSILLH